MDDLSALQTARRNGPGSLPKFITHAELQPGQPIPLDQYRCVIFGDPNDEPAKRALDDLVRTHPGGVVTRSTDLADIQAIQVFRLAVTAQ